MEYDPSQFRGTAPYYLRGRPPYSSELEPVLQRELQLNGQGRLVDVGCGPGTVGVRLGALFEHVTFVEPDADMLSEARTNALAAGLTTADFLNVRAEELDRLALRPVRVMTFGQSFHRIDQLRTAEMVYDLLEPGGSIVLITHNPRRPVPPPPADSSPIPHDEIRTLIRRYLGAELRSGTPRGSSYDAERFADTLAHTRFRRSRAVFAPGRTNLIRDVDDVIANYLSMSFAAPPLFGARLGEFVADLRGLLTRHSPDGRFWDWPGDTELIIATRE